MLEMINSLNKTKPPWKASSMDLMEKHVRAGRHSQGIGSLSIGKKRRRRR